MADSLLATATPPVLAFLLAKLTEIGTEQQVSRAYKQAQEELTFWKAFVEVQISLCPRDQIDDVKRSAHDELESIRTRLLALRATRVAEIPASKARRILLLYAGKSPTAWVGRLSFYLLTIYGLLLIAELIADKGVRSWTLLPVELSLLLLVFALAAWSRRIALRADGNSGG